MRGQYRAGAADGGAVPGYLEEIGIEHSHDRDLRRAEGRDRQLALGRRAVLPPHRQAAGGARLRDRRRLQADPAFDLRWTPAPIQANRLVIRLQPDEGVKLWLMIKDPGPGGMRLRHVPLDMSFAEAFGVRNPDAYERLLLDVIRGNQTLFMRRDEVEAAWRWIDPILEAWERSAMPPKPYTAGTWGPSAAVALIERDGRTWHEEAAA